MSRIRKLIMEDYSEFRETVFIESPFAQITEDGIGIRQVQIALTPTRLLIGGDNFDIIATTNLTNISYQHLDPEIESMELRAVIPLEFLNLKLFRRLNRQIMKVIVGNYLKVMYFEFGGHLMKNLYWNMWRDRISKLVRSREKMYRSISEKNDTSWTSNSEYELPRKIQIAAQVHTVSNNRYENDIYKRGNGSLDILDKNKVNKLKPNYLPNFQNIWSNVKNFPNIMDSLIQRTKTRLSLLSADFAKVQSQIFMKNSKTTDYGMDETTDYCFLSQMDSRSFRNSNEPEYVQAERW